MAPRTAGRRDAARAVVRPPAPRSMSGLIGTPSSSANVLTSFAPRTVPSRRECFRDAQIGHFSCMDAITLLKSDHKTVEGLFKKFEKAGPSAVKTKQQLVKKIIEELAVHAAIEEQVFYPAV